MKKRLLLILAISAMAIFAGCSNLNSYDRKYSVAYQDEQGRQISAGVELSPRGFAK